MKKVMFASIYMALALLVQACTTDDWTDDWSNPNNSDDSSFSTGGSNSSSNTGASTDEGVTTFAVAINKSTLSETETIDTSDEDNLEYSDNDFSTEVSIAFNGQDVEAATVDGVTISNNGGDVTVVSTIKGVSYTVSGTTTDGSLKIYSDKKFKLTLNGVSIKNPTGAALNIQSKKRCYLVLADGTTSTLTDGTSYTDVVDGEDMKGCLFSEGKLLVSGKGSLEVYGNTKNGIATDDYLVLRPGTNVYVNCSSNHGIKANDGVFIKGGVLNIEVSADAAKGINSEAHVVVSGGRTTIITTGNGYYDTDDKESKGAAAIKADSTFTITDGELWLKSTGTGGKGIKTDQQTYINGGNVYIHTTGGQFSKNNDTASPKGIKADGDLTIKGGNVLVRVEGKSEGSEGIESKGVLTIDGGSVQVYAYDDAINSKYNMYVNGGNVWARGINNDALDANRDLYINGGNVIAIGAAQPENALDAAEGYNIYINGGNVFGIGGSTAQTSTSSKQASVAFTASGVSGQKLGLFDASGNGVMYVEVPSTSCTAVQMSVSGMAANASYTVKYGVSVSGGTTWGGLNTTGTISGGSDLGTVTSALQVGTGMGGGMGGPGGGGMGGPGGRW